MPSDNKASYPYQLYEVVVPGEIMVVRKRKKLDFPLDKSTEAGRKLHHIHNYQYFKLFEDQLMQLREFARELYPVLINEEIAGLEQVLEGGQDNMREIGSAIQFVDAYNRLKRRARKNFSLTER